MWGSQIAAPTNKKSTTSFKSIFFAYRPYRARPFLVLPHLDGVAPISDSSKLTWFSRRSFRFQPEPDLLLRQQFQNLSTLGGACPFVCKSAIESDISSTKEPIQSND